MTGGSPEPEPPAGAIPASEADASSDFDEILAEYLLAVEAGTAPTQDEFVRRHPHWAKELSEFFSDESEVARLAAPARLERVAPPDWADPSSSGTRAEAASGSEGVPRTDGPRIRYFGEYELLEEIGRGGMGVVYRARQVRLDRTVALKMILAGQFAGAEDVKRFQVEAENAARLDHPNIVPVYEVGRHRGQHYFSMRLVEGGSLSQVLSRFTSDHPAAARLIATTARAVHYAHQRGILHRDLKPGNILVDREGQPQVTDFGLARRMETDAAGGLTMSGAILGSPRYMAPEQARGEKGLTVAADVYSLGAVLYELLTGRPPFVADTVLKTLQMVREREPSRPSVGTARVDRDLETVCLKCLAKNAQGRYASTLALAEDLERWLRREPILARPASPADRLLKWARRKPAVAALAATSIVAALLLVAMLVALPYQARLRGALKTADNARQGEATQKKLAQDALSNSEQILYLYSISWARRELQDGNVGRAAKLLDDCPPAMRNWEWHYLSYRSHLKPITIPGHKEGVKSIVFSPDGRRVASVDGMHSLRMSEALTGIGDATFPTLGGGGEKSVTSVAFHPRLARIAVARSSGPILVYDQTTGSEVVRFKGDGTGSAVVGAGAVALAYSPSGKRLVSCGPGAAVCLWDADSGALIKTLRVHAQRVSAVAYSPDGKRIASAGGEVIIWDGESGDRLLTLAAGGVPAFGVAFSPSGDQLATCHGDGSVRICNPASGAEQRNSGAGPGPVFSLAYSPDGGRLAFSAADRTVRVWHLQSQTEPVIHHQRESAVLCVAFSPDGQRLASGAADGVIQLWYAGGGGRRFDATLTSTWSPEVKCNDALFVADGNRVAVMADSAIFAADAVSGKEVYRSDAKRAFSYGDRMVYNTRSELLASGTTIWNGRSGEVIHAIQPPMEPPTKRPISAHGISDVAFSPDGMRLAACFSESAKVFIWNCGTGECVETLDVGGPPIWSIAWSPDGQCLALGGGDVGRGGSRSGGGVPGLVRLWDMAAGRVVRTITGHNYCVWAVAFSPDGKRLASGAGLYQGLGGRKGEGEVKVWDVATGLEVITLPHPICVFRVAFSPDGRWLATAGGTRTSSRDGAVKLWGPAGDDEGLTLEHAGSVRGISFSPDSKRLCTATPSPAGINVWSIVETVSQLMTRPENAGTTTPTTRPITGPSQQ